MLRNAGTAFSSKDLTRIVSAILGAADLSALEEVVLGLCRSAIGAEFGFVATWPALAGRDTADGLTSRGDPFDYAAARTMLVSEFSGASGHPRATLINSDLSNSPWHDLVLRSGLPLENLLVGPIVNNADLIGMICLGNKTGGFGPDDMAIADDFGQLAGLAIANRKAAEMLGIFNALSSSSPIGIYIVQDGQFRFVNPQFQRLTGYTSDELLGTDALRIVAPADRPGVREQAVNMLRGQRIQPYEYRIVTKRGHVRWIMETVGSFQYMGGHAAVGNFIDITDRRALEDRMAHLATHDALTGLPNRRVLEDVLSRAVSRAKRGTPSALLFLDLDNFKQVNDQLGHAAGDETLVQVANLLQRLVRNEDILVRLGGDEFAVLLEGASVEMAAIVAERLRAAVQDITLENIGPTRNLGLSIGLAAVDGTAAETVVLSRADIAMYRAKNEGRNRVIPFVEPPPSVGTGPDSPVHGAS